MSNCAVCRREGYKDWNGSDPTCAFQDGAPFSGENWNCGTVNLIRDLVYEGVPEFPKGITYQYCDDMKYATINVTDIEELSGKAYCLFVLWYKNRGGTDALWLVGKGEPKRPTEDDCLKIHRHYRPTTPTREDV